MKKQFLKIVLFAGVGIVFGALLGYVGQCAGST